MSTLVFGANSKTIQSIMGQYSPESFAVGISRNDNKHKPDCWDHFITHDLQYDDDEPLIAYLNDYQPKSFVSAVRFRNQADAPECIVSSITTELAPLRIIRKWIAQRKTKHDITVTLISSIAAKHYRPELPIEYGVTKAAAERYVLSIDSQMPEHVRARIWANILSLSEFELSNLDSSFADHKFSELKDAIYPHVGEIVTEKQIAKVLDILIHANEYGIRRQTYSVDNGLSDISVLTEIGSHL
jgi:hypothetical protein